MAFLFYLLMKSREYFANPKPIMLFLFDRHVCGVNLQRLRGSPVMPMPHLTQEHEKNLSAIASTCGVSLSALTLIKGQWEVP
jgi:hypothetical protein